MFCLRFGNGFWLKQVLSAYKVLWAQDRGDNLFPLALFLWHTGVSGFSLEILGVGHSPDPAWQRQHWRAECCSQDWGAGLDGPKGLPSSFGWCLLL